MVAPLPTLAAFLRAMGALGPTVGTKGEQEQAGSPVDYPPITSSVVLPGPSGPRTLGPDTPDWARMGETSGAAEPCSGGRNGIRKEGDTQQAPKEIPGSSLAGLPEATPTSLRTPTLYLPPGDTFHRPPSRHSPRALLGRPPAPTLCNPRL